MAHAADNVDWAILSVLGGEGPRTFQQLVWHLNLLDRLDLLMGLKRLLLDRKIVKEGDLFSLPARANPESVDPLAHINAIIRTRTSYGLSEWEAKGTLLRWSNSQAAWTLWGGSIHLAKERFGEPLRLDADMIVVPYPKTVVEPLLSKLDPLPLYGNSTEGKRRSISNPYSSEDRPIEILYVLSDGHEERRTYSKRLWKHLIRLHGIPGNVVERFDILDTRGRVPRAALWGDLETG